MADIQYRNEKENAAKWGRVIAAMVCALSFAVTATGCGKVEEPIPVDLSSANMEELEEETSVNADEAGETEQPDAESGNSESEASESEQSDEESGSKTTQDRLQSDNEQQTQDQQKQAVGSAELSGNVYSLGQDSFVVSKQETWEEDGASLAVGVAPGYEKEEDLATVYVSENCSYRYKTVKNGGINPEDISEREGSFADLRERILVDMKGSWQDDNSFRADSFVMSSFE